MDKEVSLTIKVNTNGEDKIHNVKASASELAQTIKDVEDAHESLNKQVLNINQLQQAWSNKGTRDSAIQLNLMALAARSVLALLTQQYCHA